MDWSFFAGALTMLVGVIFGAVLTQASANAAAKKEDKA